MTGATGARDVRTSPGRTGLILGALVLLAGFIAGYAGQSVVTIGAPPHDSVSAGVIGSTGGNGSEQPVRIQLLVGVANNGTADVRVVGGSDSATTAVGRLSPAPLDVRGGSTGRLTLDVTVRCDSPSELTLPALRVRSGGNDEQSVPLAGLGRLITACSQGTPQALPLTIVTTMTIGALDEGQGRACLSAELDRPRVCDQLYVLLRPPNGLPVDIRAVRAGGVPLLMTQDSAVKDGQLPILLTAPAACPPEWLSTGVPMEIDVDLTTGFTFPLRIGPVMSAWLLRTACRPPPSSTPAS